MERNEQISRLLLSTNLMADSDRDGLKRVVIIPEGKSGRVGHMHKEPMVLNAKSAESILSMFREHGVAMVVDYEHQSEFGEFTSPDGLAEAAGWVEDLEYVPGEGIVGHVKWTQDAAKRIREDKYRYLSPTTIGNRRTGEIKFLKSVALVNQPAIHNMPKVAASQRSAEMEQPMKKTITKPSHEADDKNSLAVDLDEDSRIASSVRSMLGLEDDADETTTLTALGRVCVSALRDADRDRDVEKFLQPYAAKGVIDADAGSQTMRDDYRDMVALASANRDLCKKVLDQRVSRLPAQGRTTAGSGSDARPDRRRIITSAMREFDGDARHAKVTSKAAFVNLKLIEAGKEVLKADEKGLLES